MKIDESLTDEAIQAEIGQRIARRRLDFKLTQADLAEQAGVSKRTLEHAETGSNVQLTTIIRIFRVLDLLSGLDRILPESKPRPIELMKRKNQPRQRASTRGQSASAEPWTWADEE